MPQTLPALSLIAVPGRRRATVEMAVEIERRGFAGIFAPSMFGNLSLCEALAWNTRTIPFGTAIAPIYGRTPQDFAETAAFLHEISGGRFHLGIGVAHGPSHVRMGVTPGKPLSDTRAFVEKFQAYDKLGPLPPVIVATLRRKMIALAGEIGDGLVFANASLSHTPNSLTALPEKARANPDFFIGNMIPTCISDDLAAARAVNRRTLTSYAFLPNYRNYWREAGYAEEMTAIELAIEQGRTQDVPALLHDRWLDDCTLLGPAARVREKYEAWRQAGVSTLILVPSSTAGNQMKALDEVFAAFTG